MMRKFIFAGVGLALSAQIAQAGFAYSNNGMSWRAWDQPDSLLAGEVYFATVPSTPQLEEAFPGYDAAATAQNAAQTAIFTYSSAILAGAAVTSSATPALDGTYAIDPASQQKLIGAALYIQLNQRFPGGFVTLSWPDQSGTLHAFTGTIEFVAFATALADYVAQLNVARDTSTAGGTPNWPGSNAVVIP